MRNAIDEPQTVLLLGGNSDIGLAIVRRLVSPACRHVVLACRNLDAGGRAADALRAIAPTTEVHVLAFDADDIASHAAFVDEVVGRVGDLDVVVLAFGQLGDQAQLEADPVAAAGLVTTNLTGAVSVGLAVATRLRAQGHGRLVVLSSVAGVRVRKALFVYGASKAGLDGFAQGLGDSLEGSGASVLVVRPGFVRSAMTEGLAPAPFATTPDAVAEAVVAGLRRGRRTVWVPGILRVVFTTLRHLPGPIWRRLPAG